MLLTDAQKKVSKHGARANTRHKKGGTVRFSVDKIDRRKDSDRRASHCQRVNLYSLKPSEAYELGLFAVYQEVVLKGGNR